MKKFFKQKLKVINPYQPEVIQPSVTTIIPLVTLNTDIPICQPTHLLPLSKYNTSNNLCLYCKAHHMTYLDVKP